MSSINIFFQEKNGRKVLSIFGHHQENLICASISTLVHLISFHFSKSSCCDIEQHVKEGNACFQYSNNCTNHFLVEQIISFLNINRKTYRLKFMSKEV